MIVDTKIQLVYGDNNYPYSAEAAAAQVIAALGGNPAKDKCNVVISHAPDTNIPHGRLFSSNIRLGSGDVLHYDANGCATQLLAALAGNPTVDTSIVYITMEQSVGQAGVAPPDLG